MTKEEYIKEIDRVIEKGPYKADWESLSGHKTPEWYYRDKFGIFIHWGIYSVPAYGNEWYSRNMYNKDVREFKHHVETYGTQDKFGYKDFIPMFTGAKFDANEWVSLFKKAGARFITPVCEHHDGFAMYYTDLSKWNAKNMGPKRDVAQELKAACEKEGLTFCSSTHRAEHYFFMDLGRQFDSDVNDPEYADFYGPAVLHPDFVDTMHTEDPETTGASEEWLVDWTVRTCDLIDRLQPSLLYFDWWIQNKSFKPYLKRICAYYYNRAKEWGKEVTICYKHDAFPPTVATYDIERGGMAGISPFPWETDTAIGKHSWGYTKDNEFKSAGSLICDLIDTVSKNGMMLLNVGPRPDGTITEAETEILLTIGKWLEKYGEGIYGTTPWKWFGEGSVNKEEGCFKDGSDLEFTASDFRFTYKAANVYAYWMKPEGTVARIKTFAKPEYRGPVIKTVRLLETGEELKFLRTGEVLEVEVPKQDTDLPVCIKIELE